MIKKLAFVVAMLPFAAQAADLPNYPFIHASGEGFAMIVPDLGEIDFDISVYDPEPAAAVALVGERAAQIRALLADANASVDIHNMRKEMRKSGQTDLNAVPDYEIRSAVHIAVNDLGQWRDIMQGLLAMPNIDHMATTFGRKDRLQAEKELTLAAVKDAERRAEAMAAGLGKKVGAVTAISSGQLRNLTHAVGLMPGDLYPRNRSVNVPPADKDFLATDVLRWSQTVDVIFRIK
ncbi:SIMPL domain-containing protein [Duganella sp. sic0402]|uniref:SIMPL domain-containing protein n=1 Tax=Duganella sp. sic0402 TaxID=2854786 RepID=UPI001C48D8AA|nr:SIMPL domain-containing protein [Duganella sp. sic0402]MBV7536603.1 SIMPL domain-containing protein [Duganella sp. sic0402]